MNGAESLVRTLLKGGVDVCFANPGTSEMHFVGALDRVEGMRCVLGLFEGVCSGAADGYGRMLDFPALTLLHLGPGLSNAAANLHKARRARTPVVNLVGEHATWHRGADAPLTSDIAAIAGAVSRCSRSPPRRRTPKRRWRRWRTRSTGRSWRGAWAWRRAPSRTSHPCGRPSPAPWPNRDRISSKW